MFHGNIVSDTKSGSLNSKFLSFIKGRVLLDRSTKVCVAKNSKGLDKKTGYGVTLGVYDQFDPSIPWNEVEECEETGCILKTVPVLLQGGSFSFGTTLSTEPFLENLHASSINSRRVAKECISITRLWNHSEKQKKSANDASFMRSLVFPHLIIADWSTKDPTHATMTFVSRAVRFPDMIAYFQRFRDTLADENPHKKWSRVFEQFRKSLVDAVAYLHSAEVYHTDITPQNTLIDPRSGEAVVCDLDSSICLKLSDSRIYPESTMRCMGAYDIRSQSQYLPPECYCLAYNTDQDGWVRDRVRNVWNPSKFYSLVDSFQVGLLLFVMGVGVPAWGNLVTHSPSKGWPAPGPAVMRITGLARTSFRKPCAMSAHSTHALRKNAIQKVACVYSKQMGYSSVYLSSDLSDHNRDFMASLLIADPTKRKQL